MSERVQSRADAVEHALDEPRSDKNWHHPGIALILLAGVGVVLAFGLTDLPRETARLPDIARQAMVVSLPQWGQQEVVSEVLYGTRGFDTFGETLLLLAAVTSVSVLARSPEPRHEYVGEASAGRDEQAQFDPSGRGGGGSEGSARRAEREEADEDREAPFTADPGPLGARAPERAVAMTVVVRVAARAAAVALAVMALYLMLWGYTPGSGFQAGTAVAGVAILLYAALGHRAVRGAVRPDVLEPIEILGLLTIIALGLFGLLFKGSLFANFLTLAEPSTIRAGGTNQVFSGSELVTVATGLLIAIFSLLGIRHDWAPDEDAGGDAGDGADDGTSGQP